MIPFGILIQVFIITYFNYNVTNYVLSTILFLILDLLLTIFFTIGSPSQKLVWGCAYSVMSFVTDKLSFEIAFFFMKYEANDIMTRQSSRYYIAIIYLLLCTIFVFLLIWLSKHNFYLPKWLQAVLIALIIIGIYVSDGLINLVLLMDSAAAPADWKNTLYITNLIFLLLFILLIGLVVYTGVLFQKNTVLANENHQRLMEQQQFENMKKTTQTIKAWKHDYKNHLSTLKSLIDTGQIIQSENYINELCDTLDKSPQGPLDVSSGNNILDAILENKLITISQHNITFRHLIYLPSQIPFEPTIFSSLIGNLMDNAIEACINPRITSERYIILNIKPYRENLYISLENSSSGEYERSSDGELLSSKVGTNHGIGLKRIKQISMDHGGFFQIIPDKNKFTVTILVPLKSSDYGGVSCAN